MAIYLLLDLNGCAIFLDIVFPISHHQGIVPSFFRWLESIF